MTKICECTNGQMGKWWGEGVQGATSCQGEPIWTTFDVLLSVDHGRRRNKINNTSARLDALIYVGIELIDGDPGEWSGQCWTSRMNTNQPTTLVPRTGHDEL